MASNGLSVGKDQNGLSLAKLNELVVTLSLIHSFFRERVLKPSDFALSFVMLFATITKDEGIRKTEMYRENYLRLQIIFDDFNRDPDTVMHVFSVMTPSMYEQISAIIQGGLQKKLAGHALRDWANVQRGLRLRLWFDIKVRGKRFFELPESAEGGVESGRSVDKIP